MLVKVKVEKKIYAMVLNNEQTIFLIRRITLPAKIVHFPKWTTQRAGKSYALTILMAICLVR